MTIEKIKENIDDNLGNEVRIICNGSRNRVEEYNGIIAETYNHIFIVKLKNEDKMVETKSFCYSDVLTKTVRLYFN